MNNTLQKMSSSKVEEKKFTFDDFVMVSVIGQGTYAKVFLVKHKKTEKLYALKVLKKNKILKPKNIKHILRERSVLISLKNHPFLISFHASFQSKKKLFFLLEYCPGGELFFLLQKKNRLSFVEAKFYSAQILLAIEHLHKLDLIYRDLKPENVLIDQEGYIKLTDFGLSRELSQQKAKSLCGTPEYLAPEALDKKGYGKEVDWWAFGILLYEMVIGQPPFYTENRNLLFQQIRFQNPTFPQHIPSMLKNLIKGLLQKDPLKRIGFGGAQDIKNHKFFSDVNFEKLYNKQYEALNAPQLGKDFGLNNFDKEFTNQPICSFEIKQNNSPMHFEGFSWEQA